MRTSTAYFAGVGTVAIAIAAGLGGGYLAANIVSPHEQTISKLERRMSAEPLPVTAKPSEPVPHLAATTAASNPIAPPEQQQTEAAAPSANSPVDKSPAKDKSPAEERTAHNAAPAQPTQPAPPPAKPAEQASERTATPQDAYAKARDADIKRTAVEKRRAERRQREDKRRFRQPREQELESVEAKVREMTEPRQVFAFEPERNEMPRIRLFDMD
jgi:hypothetical protein